MERGNEVLNIKKKSYPKHLCIIWHIEKGKDLQPMLNLFLVATQTVCLRRCHYSTFLCMFSLIQPQSTVQAVKVTIKLNCLVGLHTFPELNPEQAN